VKITSYKVPYKQIYFLAEEKEKFVDIISNLKEILLKINANLEIKFLSLSDINNYENINLYTILPYKFKNIKINHHFLIIDEDYQLSNYNFFKNYLKVNNYTFNKYKFRKWLLQKKIGHGIGEYVKSKITLKSFLPFIIGRAKKNKSKYSDLSITEKLKIDNWPRLKLKDLSYKFNLSSEQYCYNFFFPNNFKKKAKHVLKLLADEQSKNTYKTILFKNAEKNWHHYFKNAHNNLKYSDYINVSKESVVLNCGLAHGIEILLFKDAKKIFHIDPEGEARLNRVVKESIKHINTEHIYVKKGLYKIVVDEFNIADSSGNVYSKNKKCEFTNLKNIVNDYKIDKIDLIKADIAGAERYMVDDLIYLCNKFRPQIAISSYMSNQNEDKFILDDIVDIPYKLMNELKDYSFFIGHYSYTRHEIILYCIPNDKKYSSIDNGI
tara:strand:+ start:119 stop:1429 length:1311 start_codon:yes stop_codon:yes gene_type:complete